MSMSCTEGDTEGSYRNESSKTQNSYLGYVSDMDIACMIEACKKLTGVPRPCLVDWIRISEHKLLTRYSDTVRSFYKLHWNDGRVYPMLDALKRRKI